MPRFCQNWSVLFGNRLECEIGVYLNHFTEDQFADPEFCHTAESLRMREQLLQFIQVELDAARTKVRREHKLWTSQRIKKGDCITGLKYIGEDEKHKFYTYRYKENNSGFREGDLLVLNERKHRG